MAGTSQETKVPTAVPTQGAAHEPGGVSAPPAKSVWRVDRIIRQGLRRARVLLRPGGGGRTILSVYQHVQGFLGLAEAEFLYDAGRGQQAIVEIGSYRGKSTCLLASASAGVGGTVYAIDPHITTGDDAEGLYGRADHEALLANLKRYGVDQRVVPIERMSIDARAAWGDKAIDFLWIDGDHTYEGIDADLRAWVGLVRPGGLIAAHDHRDQFPGVARAWAGFIARDARVARHGLVRSIAWARLRR